MAVARSSFGMVTKSQGKGHFWGFSSPLTMHCKAFAAKGIIPYRPGRGDVSAKRKRDVIYDCLVMVALCNRETIYIFIVFLLLLLLLLLFFLA